VELRQLGSGRVNVLLFFLQGTQRQYLYFCTSKASKSATKLLQLLVAEATSYLKYFTTQYFTTQFPCFTITKEQMQLCGGVNVLFAGQEASEFVLLYQ